MFDFSCWSPRSFKMVNTIFMLFPARKTRAAQKRSITYARFPSKKRWHSWVTRSGYLETPLPLPQSLYGRTLERWSHNQIFSAWWVTKFSKLCCSARAPSVRRSSAIMSSAESKTRRSSWICKLVSQERDCWYINDYIILWLVRLIVFRTEGSWAVLNMTVCLI